MTYKNHALDNFLKECLREVSSPDVKIVRVGRWNDDVGDELKKCSLREVCSNLGFFIIPNRSYSKCKRRQGSRKDEKRMIDSLGIPYTSKVLNSACC